jgi:molecular chaperone DnaJ
LFQRRGQDLLCEVPINYPQAVLGATIEVPTLDGCEKLTIPPGTQYGETFTLRGKGMPDPRRHGRGDLVVQVHIEVPQSISPEHEAMVRSLAEIENANVTPIRKSFFEKLKELF